MALPIQLTKPREDLDKQFSQLRVGLRAGTDASKASLAENQKRLIAAGGGLPSGTSLKIAQKGERALTRQNQEGSAALGAAEAGIRQQIGALEAGQQFAREEREGSQKFAAEQAEKDRVFKESIFARDLDLRTFEATESSKANWLNAFAAVEATGLDSADEFRGLGGDIVAFLGGVGFGNPTSGPPSGTIPSGHPAPQQHTL